MAALTTNPPHDRTPYHFATPMRPARTEFQLDLFNGGHDTCLHVKYALGCRNYEALLLRAKGRCEMCGSFGLSNLRRKLFIDHDAAHGYWAVRGLLCWTCNFEMESPQTNYPERKAWLRANPFYLDVFKAYGMSGLAMNEPPLGSRVTDAAGRQWTRHQRGWEIHPNIRHVRVRDWRYLHYHYGPHILGRYLVLPKNVDPSRPVPCHCQGGTDVPQ